MGESAALSVVASGDRRRRAVRRLVGQLLQRVHRPRSPRRIDRAPRVALSTAAERRCAPPTTCPIISYLSAARALPLLPRADLGPHPLVERWRRCWRRQSGGGSWPAIRARRPPSAWRASRATSPSAAYADRCCRSSISRPSCCPTSSPCPPYPILYPRRVRRARRRLAEARLIGAAAGYLFFRLIAEFYYYVLKREGLGPRRRQAAGGHRRRAGLAGAAVRRIRRVVRRARSVSLPIAIWQRRGADGAKEREPLRRLQIPFGPFLAVAALSYLFIGPALLQRWLGLDG